MKKKINTPTRLIFDINLTFFDLIYFSTLDTRCKGNLMLDISFKFIINNELLHKVLIFNKNDYSTPGGGLYYGRSTDQSQASFK